MKKTNNKRITLGIGMALAVLVALTTTAAATGEYFYLVEKDSNCTGDTCTKTVWAMVHTSESDVGSAQIHLEFDPEVVNITDISAPTDPVWHMWDWKHEGDYVFAIGSHFGGVGPGELQVAELTIECQKAGLSTLNFTHFYPMTPDPTAIATTFGVDLPATSINGTFTCILEECCLGTCYELANCTGNATENISCKDCIGVAGLSWSNYEFESPCAAGVTVPRRCYDYCPECCDGLNNSDGDAYIDWPADPECACCLDESETNDEGCPVECVPELATVTFVSVGLLGLIGAIWRRRYE